MPMSEDTDRIVALAEKILGNRGKAQIWLRTPDERIGMCSPLSVLHTDSGQHLIEGMLWQIDEGIYR
jgi:uncharacterized protein (DUF2384 family)